MIFIVSKFLRGLLQRHEKLKNLVYNKTLEFSNNIIVKFTCKKSL